MVMGWPSVVNGQTCTSFPVVNGRKYEVVMIVRTSGGENLPSCLQYNNLALREGRGFVYDHMITSQVHSLEYHDVPRDRRTPGGGVETVTCDRAPEKKICMNCNTPSGAPVGPHAHQPNHHPSPCSNNLCYLHHWYHDYHSTTGRHYPLYKQLKNLTRQNHTRVLVIFQGRVGLDEAGRATNGELLNRIQASSLPFLVVHNNEVFSRYIYLPLDFHQGAYQIALRFGLGGGATKVMVETQRHNNIQVFGVVSSL